MATNDFIKNGGLPAFPSDPNVLVSDVGLTKREYFAAMAMQGLIINLNNGYSTSPQLIAKESIAHADELLKQLDQ